MQVGHILGQAPRSNSSDSAGQVGEDQATNSKVLNIIRALLRHEVRHTRGLLDVLLLDFRQYFRRRLRNLLWIGVLDPISALHDTVVDSLRLAIELLKLDQQPRLHGRVHLLGQASQNGPRAAALLRLRGSRRSATRRLSTSLSFTWRCVDATRCLRFALRAAPSGRSFVKCGVIVLEVNGGQNIVTPDVIAVLQAAQRDSASTTETC